MGSSDIARILRVHVPIRSAGAGTRSQLAELRAQGFIFLARVELLCEGISGENRVVSDGDFARELTLGDMRLPALEQLAGVPTHRSVDAAHRRQRVGARLPRAQQVVSFAELAQPLADPGDVGRELLLDAFVLGESALELVCAPCLPPSGGTTTSV